MQAGKPERDYSDRFVEEESNEARYEEPHLPFPMQVAIGALNSGSLLAPARHRAQSQFFAHGCKPATSENCFGSTLL